MKTFTQNLNPLFLSCIILFNLSCNSDEPELITDPGILGDGLLTEKIEQIRAAYDIPALGGLFLDDGSIIEMGASGFRAEGSNEKVTTGDKWHLGSLTKAMTATMAARLVEKGEIQWSTTISEIFSDELDQIHNAYHSIRIDELFSHTSGIHNDIVNVPSWDIIRSEQGSEEDLRYIWTIELLAKEPIGDRGDLHYSNAGYIVGGAMIEKVTGKTWRELMKTELFEPLEMSETGFMAPGSSGQKDQPWGHAVNGNNVTPMDPGDPFSDNPLAIGPAGVVHTTFEDYSAYMKMHIDGANGNSDFLSSDTFQKLHTPAPGTDYSLGWGSGEFEGSNVLNHDGSNTLWYARVILNTTSQLGLLMVTNRGDQKATDAINSLNLLFNQRSDNAKN